MLAGKLPATEAGEDLVASDRTSLRGSKQMMCKGFHFKKVKEIIVEKCCRNTAPTRLTIRQFSP